MSRTTPSLYSSVVKIMQLFVMHVATYVSYRLVPQKLMACVYLALPSVFIAVK